MERKRGEFAWVAGLAALVLLPLLARYPLRGFQLPMGPDAPVYMWWAHLAQLEGLSVANWRPGAPALTLMLGESLGLSQLQVTAGLGAVFAASIAMAAFAAVRHQLDLWVALLAGLLVGAYATHLAGGYFSNIIIATSLMAAIALLGANSSRGTVVAAVALLGAGGLAHPMFLVASLVILALAAALVKREERNGLIAAGIGAGAITGAGLLSMFIGPRPLAVDTSADAFMRRAGFDSELAEQFRSRLLHHTGRYMLWLTLPLAWLGRKGLRGGVTNALLTAWAAFCLVGVVASFAIGSIPGVRMLAFAFPLPVLAALGVSWLRMKIPSRAAGTVLAAVLVALMLAGAGLTWARERPYADILTVDQVQRAGDAIRQEAVGTALVFVVDERRADLAAYRTTNRGNILRAYLPADRIEDVRLFFGRAEDLLAQRATPSDDPTREALSRIYWEDIQGIGPYDGMILRLSAMTTGAGAWEPIEGVTDILSKDPPARGELTPPPPEPRSIVLGGVLMFVALIVVGAGWARTLRREAAITLALSPAFGAAALILTGVLLDRLGLRLDGSVVPISTVTVAVGGYLAAWLSKSKVEPETTADAASQVTH